MTSIGNIVPPDSPVTIIDIGASIVGETVPPYQELIDAGSARLIAFEPDQAALEVLRQRYPAPHLCLPFFVGNGKTATYYETNWGPTGSLFEPNTPLLRMFHNLSELTEVVATHSVETTRLDDIAEITDADFIKIDVQGAEQMIFENAERLLEKVALIQTEVSWVEMYKGMPLFGDIDRSLRTAGFQWHTRLGCGYRSFLPFLNPENPHAAFRQELWGNVVYVRDWMHFGRLPPLKLVKLAVLLHDLYNSYDLAHLAFAAADAQAGTNYAANYAEWISTEDQNAA